MANPARWLGGVAIVGFGCAGSFYQLSPEGAQVRMTREDPPTECTDLGAVESGGYGTNTVERSQNQLRNEAAALGANVVRVETQNGLRLGGTAFRCP